MENKAMEKKANKVLKKQIIPEEIRQTNCEIKYQKK